MLYFRRCWQWFSVYVGMWALVVPAISVLHMGHLDTAAAQDTQQAATYKYTSYLTWEDYTGIYTSNTNLVLIRSETTRDLEQCTRTYNSVLCHHDLQYSNKTTCSSVWSRWEAETNISPGDQYSTTTILSSIIICLPDIRDFIEKSLGHYILQHYNITTTF